MGSVAYSLSEKEGADDKTDDLRPLSYLWCHCILNMPAFLVGLLLAWPLDTLRPGFPESISHFR
jgi:hypothetical protein